MRYFGDLKKMKVHLHNQNGFVFKSSLVCFKLSEMYPFNGADSETAPQRVNDITVVRILRVWMKEFGLVRVCSIIT